jgi:hypothetical protein
MGGPNAFCVLPVGATTATPEFALPALDSHALQRYLMDKIHNHAYQRLKLSQNTQERFALALALLHIFPGSKSNGEQSSNRRSGECGEKWRVFAQHCTLGLTQKKR